MSGVYVGVIGSAGRGADAKAMTSEIFGLMCQEAKRIIAEDWKHINEQKSCDGLPEAHLRLTLVSGGSAWSDHVAVHLYLYDPLFAKAKLLLYLPCKFVNDAFVDEQAWHTNAKTLNSLHNEFSTKLGRSSLADLKSAKEKGAQFDTSGRGFLARNLLLGKKATHLIAFSFANGAEPTDGGTAHTWKHATTPTSNRRHVPIKSLNNKK